MPLSKILLITLEYPPFQGGVARYYGNLVENWEEEIRVLNKGLTSKFIWPRWLPALWKTWRMIKKEEIKMLWVGQVLPLGYIALWFKRRRGLPYVVFTHGMDILTPQASKRKKLWLTKILKEARLVVANSNFTREEIKKLGIEENKITVVYPCAPKNLKTEFFDNGLLKEKYQLEGKKIILSVGRLVKRKGFDKVIEVLPRILKRAPEAVYVIIGTGEERENLKRQIDDWGLGEKAMILEKVGDAELAGWYESCAVFTMPCCQLGPDVEGFGTVFLEAQSFGKPVVAGNSGGAGETVRHGYGGYLINPANNEELYQALLKLLSDEEFAKRMGEYGRKWVEENFSWEREAAKLEQAIKNSRLIKLTQ
ncbi:MAG: glycosyltransferase family 4 protein [Candidatus Magasanikbacteria bacterium]|nr:glycosyltransferase family 4 protein [Candidatus Magasanikbacteria bacterium]